jgi:hypothetical protein
MQRDTCVMSSNIVLDGGPKRFCHQCQRFHPLEEFDDEKRSCRINLVKRSRLCRNERMKDKSTLREAAEGTQVNRMGK